MTGVWFQRSTAVLTRGVGGQEVLLASTGREDVDQLAGTAAAVWELLRVPRRIEDLLDELSRMYRTRPEAIGPDVEQLLRQLVARGWVEAVSDGDD